MTYNINICDTISLYRFVDDIGYCRRYFKNILDNETTKFDKHLQIVDENKSSVDNIPLSDGYYLLKNNEYTDILVKCTNKVITSIDNYPKNHLVSSIIRNIIINGDKAYDNNIRGNSIVFLYYYHSLYAYRQKINIEGITERVIKLISDTISTMIAKEKTLYKNHQDIIDEFINIMQMRLNSERVVNTANTNFNIRF